MTGGVEAQPRRATVSLLSLIRRREVNTRVMALLQQRAVPAIARARNCGRLGGISAGSIAFSADFSHIEVTPDTGAAATEAEVVAMFGAVLLDAVLATPHRPRRLVAIARQCAAGDIRTLSDLDLRLERRLSDTIYIPLIIIVLALLALLYAFSH